MKNTIYLRRKKKVVVPEGAHELPTAYLATALKNIESLGYTFSLDLIEKVQRLSKEDFLAFYTEVVPALRVIVGDHVNYKPMYPNFPQQVMDASQAELFFTAIIHYLTLALSVHEVRKRLPLLRQSQYKVIEAGTDSELLQLGMNLLRSKTSLSAQDKADLEWLIQEYDEIAAELPEEIPHKENMAAVASLLLKHDKLPASFFSRYCKTATDVLRIAVALSDGDVSLAAPAKFRKFRRSERRLLLRLLEASPNLADDMLRHKNRWIRLGEILHPFEYKQQYPRSAEAFDILRNNKKLQTFHSRVELSLERQDVEAAANLLSERPGEFARRLDHLLRLSEQSDEVLQRFQAIVPQVSTPVLLQVMNHFQKRNAYGEWRTFFPKGNVAKAQTIKNTLPPLGTELTQKTVHICKNTLLERFSQLPSLGQVYVDSRLQDYMVPFSQRSASKALRTIVRGSRIPIPEGDTIRFFTWWNQGMINNVQTGRVDIDLSAVLYDSNWRYMEHISYTNLRSNQYRAYHSGDIVEAPNGACEFIDLDISSIVKYGGRYVVMSLNSFTQHPYCNLPECFAGWMIRTEPQSGEIFEPRTVQDKIDIASDSTICIPVILDLIERKVVWTDIALRADPFYANNVEGNAGGMELMGRAFCGHCFFH